MIDNNGLEIERRYLLKDFPKLDYHMMILIEQFYHPDGSRYRKEFYKNKFTYLKTNKTFISKGVNKEDEIKINRKEFIKAMNQCSTFVAKTRWLVTLNDLTWEIDVFNTSKLVIAEIELKGTTLSKVKIPKQLAPYVLMEITGKKKFSNRSLSVNYEHFS